MAKTIIVTEGQLKTILNEMVSDTYENKKYPINPAQVLIVKEFLDKNFKKGVEDVLSEDGNPVQNEIVTMVSPNGVELKSFYKDDLKEYLNERYKNMFLDTEQRKRFLGQVTEDWYHGRITPYGGLSTNYV